ncbi:MAG TPA: hypothetical protein VGH07_02205, partial [Chthoniobacterales bacterium]
PPRTLLEKCSVPADAIDPIELERASWLWSRRPDGLFHRGSKVLWGRLSLFVIGMFSLILFDIPGLLAAAVISLVVGALMFLRFYQRELWKRDYAAALFRIVRSSLR